MLFVGFDTDEIIPYKAVFENSEIEIETVCNGTAAVKTAKKNPPNAFIVRFFGKNFDGLKFCEIRNADETLKNIPCIFIDTVYTKEEEKAAREAGADEIINPLSVSAAELKEKIAKILENGREKGKNYIPEITEEGYLDLHKQFISIWDTFPDAIIIHLNGKIVYANRKAFRITGARKKQDLIGQKISKFIHPDYFLLVQERMLLLSRKKQNLEPVLEKFVTLDNRIVEAEVSPYIFNYLGQPAYLIIAHDVTEENRKKRLLEAFYNAGGALLKATTKDEIFEIVAEELIKSDISTVLLLADETGENVYVKNKRFNSSKLKLLETIGAIKNKDFVFPMRLIDGERDLRAGKTLYRENLNDILDKILPPIYKGIAEQVLELLNIKTNITSPLIADGKFIGLLSFQSKDIRESDIDAFSIFTQQFALAWRNVDLLEKMQEKIEERKEAEKALRDSEELFRAVAEVSQTIIYVISGDRPIYVNPAGEKITGYTYDEMLRMKFWNLVHPDYRELTKERGFARQRGENVPARYTFPIITKSGETIWLDYSAATTEIGGKTVIVGTGLDITEQKRTLEKLRENEERFRTLTETTSTAIFIYSGNKFIYANRATFELTGYSEEEFLKMNFWDIVHPDYKEMIKQRGLARQKGEKVPTRYEFKIITKNGEERWVDFTAGKINWGGIAASIGTATDITARKMMERQSNDENG